MLHEATAGGVYGVVALGASDGRPGTPIEALLALGGARQGVILGSQYLNYSN